MILIKNGYLRPVTSPDIACGDILIDEGKIVAIGTDLEIPEGAEVIQAAGYLVTPGFVDGHCHIGMHEEATRWEGNDTNESSDPVTPQVRAIDSINPLDEAFDTALRGGVTTAVTGPGSANVVGGTFCAIKLYGDCVDDMLIKQPVAMKIAFGENPKGAYGQNGRKAPITRMMTAALLRETLKKAQRYMEEVDEAEKDDTKKRPFDMKLEALLPVMRGEIPLKSHAHRADDILTALRLGREFGLRQTIDHCTEGYLILDELKRCNAKCILGPLLSERSKIELGNMTFKAPSAFYKAGVPFALMTDHPVIPLHFLMVEAALCVREGLPEYEALKSITINAADVIGLSDLVGSLKAGKLADVVMYDGHPLDTRSHVTTVIASGEKVYER